MSKPSRSKEHETTRTSVPVLIADEQFQDLHVIAQDVEGLYLSDREERLRIECRTCDTSSAGGIGITESDRGRKDSAARTSREATKGREGMRRVA